ncbi:MAG: bifunctional diguanylate cyclase/phosphodiesterase, partial [Pseudomonadota bacterium]
VLVTITGIDTTLDARLLDMRASARIEPVGGGVPSTAVLLGVALLLGMGVSAHARARRALVAPSAMAIALAAAVGLAALLFEPTLSLYIPFAAALVLLGCFVALDRLMALYDLIQTQRLKDPVSGLPNGRAFKRALRRGVTAQVATARIADFAALAARLSEDELARLLASIARRLSVVGDSEEIHFLGDGVLGWIMTKSASDEGETTFEAARAFFNAPFEVAGERIRLTVHFGSAPGSITGAVRASELAQKRDLIWSGSTATIFEEEQYRERVLSEFDEALENGAIAVMVQPKLALASGQIVGGECVLRWTSPRIGRIAPADFIPILEAAGRLEDLILFVLRGAMARTEEAMASGHEINLTVPIAASLLADQNFVNALADELQAGSKATARGITLEFDKNAFSNVGSRARATLAALRQTDARICLGGELPIEPPLDVLPGIGIDMIKCESSFARDLVEDETRRKALKMSIERAHKLGLEYAIDGVETFPILDVLTSLGADYAQGWQVGAPMLWDEFLSLVADDIAAAA